MARELLGKGPHVPADPRAVKRLEQAIQLGQLEDFDGLIFVRNVPRYLVTYMNSQTGGREADEKVREASEAIARLVRS